MESGPAALACVCRDAGVLGRWSKRPPGPEIMAREKKQSWGVKEG